MGGAPTPPPTPNPYAVANAQQLANVAVAIANTALGNADEAMPGGSVSYTIESTYTMETPNYNQTTGELIGMEQQEVPRWKRTVALSTAEQANYDLQIQVNTSMLQWAKTQADRSNDLLQEPFSIDGLTPRRTTPAVPTLDGVMTLGAPAIIRSIDPGDLTTHIAAVRDAINDRLQYQIAIDRAALRVQLENAGLFAGMAAYDREMLSFDRRTNDGTIQAFLKAQEEQTRLVQTSAAIAEFANRANEMDFRQRVLIIEMKDRTALQQMQAYVEIAEYVNTVRSREMQELIAERAQALNEISTIKSGGQVQIPQFAQFRPGHISDTPLAQSVYQSAAMDWQKYQLKEQRQQELIGGMIGLAGSLALAPMTGGGSLAGNLGGKLLGAAM